MKKTLSFALNVLNIFSMPKKRAINKILGITLICLTVGLMFSQLLGVTNAEDSPIAKIDGKLLDLIDQYADEYYDETWDLTLDQYKAWIVTIAWGEGKWGGYTAHSLTGKLQEVELDGDRFDHVVVGSEFFFSTGIGPFQMDRGGPYGKWGSMPTIEKLDPEIALGEVLYWHYEVKDFGEGTCLNDFQAEARRVWYAVSDAKVAQHWYEVTGTSWDEHKDDKIEDFDWSDVADSIRRDDPEHFFENNVRFIGEVKWDVTFTTDSGREVSFDGYYPTWTITARHYLGTRLFDYYYTYDASLDCEVWVWDNSGEEDEFKYIFARELNGPFPENRTHEGAYWIGNRYIARAGEYKLDKPALNPNLVRERYPFVPVDLVLVLDRSGSMGSSMGSKTRMQGAKDSAIAVIDALMPHDRVAVVSFATTATTDVQLTSDFEYAKTEIQKISASGMTSFGAGLSLAVNELKTRGSEGHAWAIIFMSDGWHNTAPSPDPYVLECRNLGIPIYTVGLGRIPSDVNEALLKQMADETGGKYLFAPSLYEMQNIFIRFSLEVTGWTPVAEFSGLIGESQTVVAGTFDIAPLTASARVTLNWPGSDLDLIIVRPDGSEVNLGTGLDNTYSGATAKPEWVILHYPQAGTWTAKVYGKVINSPDEPFIVWISTYVPPVPHDTTPPTTSLTIGSPQYIDELGNTYATSATEFTLDAIDNGGAGSGVATTAYKISNTTYSTGWITYTAPFNFAGFSDGAYTIAYNSTDNAGNVEPTNTAIVILDNTGPSVTILNPPSGWALQDGVTFRASAIDSGSGVHSLNISIREANGAEGIPVGFEDLSVAYNAITGEWTLFFDTLLLPDGYYIVLAKAKDNLGNIGQTLIVPYSIRNWAVIELLPASETNKAGRTMPVKFALRVAATVDPTQPFVYNEELTIKIYAADDPSNILQTSTFGDTAQDYRINTVDEHYITNFRTLKTPKTYVVEIYRKGMLIGTFEFRTVK